MDDTRGSSLQLTLRMSKRKLPDPAPLDPEPLNPPRLERNLLFLFSSSSLPTSSRGVKGATASAAPSSSANCTLTSFFCDSAACCTSFALSSVSGFTSCRETESGEDFNSSISRERASASQKIGRSIVIELDDSRGSPLHSPCHVTMCSSNTVLFAIQAISKSMDWSSFVWSIGLDDDRAREKKDITAFFFTREATKRETRVLAMSRDRDAHRL